MGSALFHLVFGSVLHLLLFAMAVLLVRGRARVTQPHPEDLDRSSAGDAVVAVLELLTTALVVVVLIVTLGGSLGFLNRPFLVLTLLGAGLVGTAAVQRASPAVVITLCRRWLSLVLSGFSDGIRRLLSQTTGRLTLFLVWAAFSLLLASRFYLPPVAWDALTYHLRYPAHWLSSGRLQTLTEPFGDPSPTFYPLNGEMVFYWSLLSTGSDLWVSLAQLPFALISMLGIIELVVLSGGRRAAGALAALAWFSVPGLLRQSLEPGVDIITCATFLAALVFCLRWLRNSRHRDAALGAASAGLLLGTKYLGAVLLIPLAGAILAAVTKGIRRHELRLIGAGVVLFLATGAFAYVRNFVNGGNPLLPMEITVGPLKLPGWRSAADYFSPERSSLRAFLLSPHLLLEWGIALPLAGTALLIMGWIGPTRKPVRRDVWWLASVAVLFILTFTLFVPYREYRFLFPLNALALALLALAIRGDGWKGQLVFLLIVALNMPPGLFYWAKDALARPDIARLGLGVALAFLPLVLVLRGPGQRSHSLRLHRFSLAPGLAATLLLAAWTQSTYQQHRYQIWKDYWSNVRELRHGMQRRDDFAEAAASWVALADRTGSRSVTVAYSGTNIPYPLAGSRLENRVIFVPRNGAADSWLYDWGSAPNPPALQGEQSQWLRNVVALGVDYLCVYQIRELSPDLPVEARWAELAPEMFVPVSVSEHARLYEVRRDVASSAISRLTWNPRANSVLFPCPPPPRHP